MIHLDAPSLHAVIAGLFLMATGCNDNGFSSSNAAKKGAALEDSNQPTPLPNKPSSKPGDSLGNESDTDVSTHNNDTDSDLGDNSPSDLTEEDTSVTFGADEVFHLGDGSFEDSSCRVTVKTFGLSGVRYFFEFEVVNNNTNIDITINRICGVDYPDSNFAALYRDGQEIESLLIPAGAFQLGFNTRVLNRGYYRIEVVSRLGSVMDFTFSDADDFIIGDLRIRGSNRIVRGDFGVN